LAQGRNKGKDIADEQGRRHHRHRDSPEDPFGTGIEADLFGYPGGRGDQVDGNGKEAYGEQQGNGRQEEQNGNLVEPPKATDQQAGNQDQAAQAGRENQQVQGQIAQISGHHAPGIAAEKPGLGRDVVAVAPQKADGGRFRSRPRSALA